MFDCSSDHTCARLGLHAEAAQCLSNGIVRRHHMDSYLFYMRQEWISLVYFYSLKRIVRRFETPSQRTRVIRLRHRNLLLGHLFAPERIDFFRLGYTKRCEMRIGPIHCPIAIKLGPIPLALLAIETNWHTGRARLVHPIQRSHSKLPLHYDNLLHAVRDTTLCS